MNSNYVNWCGEKNVAKEPQTMVYQTLRQYFPDIRIERKQETDGPKRGQWTKKLHGIQFADKDGKENAADKKKDNQKKVNNYFSEN